MQSISSETSTRKGTLGDAIGGGEEAAKPGRLGQFKAWVADKFAKHKNAVRKLKMVMAGLLCLYVAVVTNNVLSLHHEVGHKETSWSTVQVLEEQGWWSGFKTKLAGGWGWHSELDGRDMWGRPVQYVHMDGKTFYKPYGSEKWYRSQSLNRQVKPWDY